MVVLLTVVSAQDLNNGLFSYNGVIKLVFAISYSKCLQLNSHIKIYIFVITYVSYKCINLKVYCKYNIYAAQFVGLSANNLAVYLNV